MLAIVTGLIAYLPVGGMTCHYLQYVLGLRRLGWDVLYLEDTGQWNYSPDQLLFMEDPGYNIAYLAEVMERSGLSRSWCYRSADGGYQGLTKEELTGACRDADIFLNVSGSCWLRPEYRATRRLVYIDTDPGVNQFAIARVLDGEDHEVSRSRVDCLAKHDYHFTFGENIGRPDCTLPNLIFHWLPTRQPIIMDMWKYSSLPVRASFTTVLSWVNRYKGPVEYRGARYRGKELQFQRILTLPQMVGAQFELAALPSPEFESNGWRLVDPRPVSRNLEAYRAYIQGSRGELSAAKDLYVATKSGWFSERTACYLASGRPAIVQDTGFSRFLPTGVGLCAFSDLDGAADAVKSVTADYQRHCRAARAVAEAYFDSDKVLGKLLRELDL